jgi:hypothetical protein
MTKRSKGARPAQSYRAARRAAAMRHAKENKVPFRLVWERAGYRTFGKR